MTTNGNLATSSLWTRPQISIVLALNAAGLLLGLAGWLGARGDHDLGAQIGYVNLAVVGLLIAALADGTCVLVGRRAVGRYRRALLSAPARGPRPAARPSVELLWVPGTARVHDPACIFVAGKTSKQVTRRGADRYHLVDCEACR